MKRNKSYDIIRTEVRQDETNRYNYQLMMRRSDAVATWRMPLYSIRVNMTDACGNEGTADATDVFCDIDKAIDFFEKIVRNLATPIDLDYILDDELYS